MALGARVEYVLGNYDESPEGEVRKDLDSTFAKWENAKRVERSNRGKMRKAEMGKWVAGPAPYGYRIDPEALGGLAVYEPEAEVMRMIFTWYVEDKLSLHQIVRELSALGIKTQRNYKTWARGTIANMLKDSAYAGYFYYNKYKRIGKKHVKRDKSEWIRIECTPIIHPQVFEAAQEIIKHKRDSVRRQPKRFYLLSGMVFCSDCKRPYLTQTITRRVNPYTQKGYRHRINQGHCCNRWITGKKLEPIVWEEITKVLLDPSSLRKGYEQMMEEEQQKQARRLHHLEAIQAGIERLQKKRARLQAIYLDPDIGMTKEEFLAEKKLLEDQIESAYEEMEHTETDLKKVPTERDLIALEEMAKTIVTSLGENLDIPPYDKRRVLEMLNVQVIISPDRRIKIQGWFTSQSDGFSSPPSLCA